MNPPKTPPAAPLLHLGHPESYIPGYEVPQAASPPLGGRRIALLALLAMAVAGVGLWLHNFSAGAEKPRVPALLMAPFVLLLASIAIMPFLARHWWERNYARVAIALGSVVGVYYLFGLNETGIDGGRLAPRALAQTVSEYISFLFLLGSLFIISGSILIRVRARATPIANTTLLLIGAIIANLFGTTGASMLLIRPYLRMNRSQLRPYHVVFFIFIVSNAGGALTPIGDPPLFLGFLQGVPFWWVLEHCWPIWLLVNGALLALFLIVDTFHTRRLPHAAPESADLGPGVSLYGAANLVWIAFVIAGILLHEPVNGLLHTPLGIELPVREFAMIIAAALSLACTPYRVHAENHFNYAPIKEVAFLFTGIFLTMVPALNYLYHENARPTAERSLMLQTPGEFYFASGTLSSVLDNAPTYLTFLQSKLGQLDPDAVTARANERSMSEPAARIDLLVSDPELNRSLVAISMGAVLFGAMTYIGNGPNFMVKSIAEHTGAPTPSFFGYVFKYALPILLPVLVVVWAVFLK